MEKEEKVKLKKVGNILLQLRDTTVSHSLHVDNDAVVATCVIKNSPFFLVIKSKNRYP